MLKAMLGKVGTKGGVVLLLIGGAAGAVGAQAIDALVLTEYIQTGLFTVRSGETAAFNVSFDELASAEHSTSVSMRLYDEAGTIVARRQVTLEPGQSASLRYRTPGRYRAFASVSDPTDLFSSRRNVVGTVEVGGADDLTTPIRFVCSGGEHVDVGRP